MSETPLDQSDPMVREMAEDNHHPVEAWLVSGSLSRVYCGTCGNAWPCATRRALSALSDE